MRIVVVLLILCLPAAFAAGVALTAERNGSWLLVRDPADPRVCAALDQDTGAIAGRWKPEGGRCSMRVFTWRRAFFLPEGWPR